MSRFLAIDADLGGLYLASGSVRGPGIQVEQAFAVVDEYPTPLTPSTAAIMGTRLKAILKEAGVSAAPVLLSFGRDRVVVKDVRFPPVAASEEAAVVRFQAQKDLAEAPDDVVMDYFVHPVEPGEIQRRATVLFIKKDLSNAAQELCTTAGLKLAAITARPIASLAAARRAIAIGVVPPPEEAGAAIAILNIWGTGGEFSVGRGKQLLYSRTVSSAALRSEAALVGEIKRSLASFNNQSPAQPVRAIYLAEGDPTGTSWIGRLQATLGAPVHGFDPLAGSNVSANVPPELHGRFAAAVGLLAGKTSGESLGVNFLDPRAPRTAPNKYRNLMVLGGMLVALFLLGLSGFLYWQLTSAEAEAVRLVQDKSDLEEKQKGLAIENKRVEAAQKYLNREVSWIDVYYDLNDQFPSLEKFRLMEFDGKLLPLPVVKANANTPKPPGAPTAPLAAAAKPGNKPVDSRIGTVHLMLLGEDSVLPEKLKDILNKEPGYGNARMTTGGPAGGSGSKSLQFTVNADVFARKPTDFKRKLAAPPEPPKILPVGPKVEDPNAEPFDPFNGFTGGDQ